MKKLVLTLLAACSLPVFSQNTGELRFHDGHFRIAQFTDFHWGHDGFNPQANYDLMQHVVRTQHPDLIVLTGDIVTDGKAKDGWDAVLKMCEDTRVPYAIVLGNHDAETEKGITADSIFSWFKQKGTRCVNAYGAGGIFGHGNKALAVKAEKSDNTAAVVYTIDSNDYPDDPRLARYSTYAFIHRDQIDWYIDQSEKFKAANGGEPVPSVAYFHICVPEFQTVAEDPTHFGYFQEPTCPSDINTGFFGAACIQGDIMGMFVGHDHSNDYIGILDGIALGYGRQSGVIYDKDYDPLTGDESLVENVPQGSRIVELNEGERTFTTWLCTMKGPQYRYHYPLGINDGMLENSLPAQNVTVTKNGVNYVYYENGGKESCEEMFSQGTRVEEGTIDNFNLSRARQSDHFGFDFTAYLQIDETAIYRFTLSSDDGSILYIDGKEIVNNDGSHSMRSRKNFVALDKGFHKIEVKYFENYADEELSLMYCNSTFDDRSIPSEKLFLVK